MQLKQDTDTKNNNMPGEFINTGTNPFGKLSLVNNSNSGNLALTRSGFTISSSDFVVTTTFTLF